MTEMLCREESADIAIVGAGPKAAAIAAKAHVLNMLGITNVRLLVLERNELASSWTGDNGFTTGAEELGTRPEKDIGFPYESHSYGTRSREVDAAMMQFSWHAYLVAQGEYKRWIDSGAPQPLHREFARYLAWTFSRAREGVRLQQAKVNRATPLNGGWSLRCQLSTGQDLNVEIKKGLVITGAGEARELACAPEVKDRIITAATKRNQVMALNLSRTSRICIVGAGESAASMALFLIDCLGDDIELTFVAPTLPSSRAESYLENSVYSDPKIVRWDQLPLSVRTDFIARTDRGVMSPAALARLTKHRKLSFVLGRVRCVQRNVAGRVGVVVDQVDEIVRADFDAVANCIGFCPLAPLISILGDARQFIESRLSVCLDEPTAVSLHLDPSFSLRGLESKIHLPGLAGLQYGPGFSNLSCLGTMSDRVLSAYWGIGTLGMSVNTPDFILEYTI